MRWPRPPPQMAEPREPSGDHHVQVAKVLSMAQEMAERLTSEAKSEADTMLTDARTKAEQLLSEARTKSDGLVNDARARAETMLNDARTRAETLERQSRDKASKLVGDAERQQSEIIGSITRDKCVSRRRSTSYAPSSVVPHPAQDLPRVAAAGPGRTRLCRPVRQPGWRRWLCGERVRASADTGS